MAYYPPSPPPPGHQPPGYSPQPGYGPPVPAQPTDGYGPPLPAHSGYGPGPQPGYGPAPQPGYGAPPPPPGPPGPPESTPPPKGKSGFLALVLALAMLFIGGGVATVLLLWENEYDHRLEGSRRATDNLPHHYEYVELPEAGISYYHYDSWAPVDGYHDTDDYLVWIAPGAGDDDRDLNFDGKYLTSAVIMVDTENTDLALSERADSVAVDFLQGYLTRHSEVEHVNSFELEVDESPAYETDLILLSDSAGSDDFNVKVLSIDLGDHVADVIAFTNHGDTSLSLVEANAVPDTVEVLN